MRAARFCLKRSDIKQDESEKISRKFLRSTEIFQKGDKTRDWHLSPKELSEFFAQNFPLHRMEK